MLSTAVELAILGQGNSALVVIIDDNNTEPWI
jgi:hypothetical protein